MASNKSLRGIIASTNFLLQLFIGVSSESQGFNVLLRFGDKDLRGMQNITWRA